VAQSQLCLLNSVAHLGTYHGASAGNEEGLCEKVQED